MIAVNVYFFLSVLAMAIFGPTVCFIVGASLGSNDE